MKYEDMTPGEQANARAQTLEVLEAFGGDLTRWYVSEGATWPPKNPGPWLGFANVEDTGLLDHRGKPTIKMKVWCIAHNKAGTTKNPMYFGQDSVEAIVAVLNFMQFERSQEQAKLDASNS